MFRVWEGSWKCNFHCLTYTGTVYIIEHQSTSTAAIATDTEAASANGYRLDNSGFKTDPTGQTVLVPQPSDDPNDPLVCHHFWYGHGC